MKRCTNRQLAAIDFLLKWCDRKGTLVEAIREIKPDLEEDEDFMEWMARQSISKGFEVINILRSGLGSGFPGF
jgi:hypothetical protein